MIAHWNKKAAEVLVGRKIVDAFYGGDNDLIISLDDGTLLQPMRDDEGNGPGALSWIKVVDGKITDTGTLPVLQERRALGHFA